MCMYFPFSWKRRNLKAMSQRRSTFFPRMQGRALPFPGQEEETHFSCTSIRVNGLSSNPLSWTQKAWVHECVCGWKEWMAEVHICMTNERQVHAVADWNNKQLQSVCYSRRHQHHGHDWNERVWELLMEGICKIPHTVSTIGLSIMFLLPDQNHRTRRRMSRCLWDPGSPVSWSLDQMFYGVLLLMLKEREVNGYLISSEEKLSIAWSFM